MLLACLAALVSLVALLHYYRWGQILLSGDAVAHINIARRLLDSRTPGPLQLGTVWLPLQHILTAPFVISDWAWSTGIGGAIPSMVAYVVATVGMYRLVLRGLQAVKATSGLSRISGWVAAIIFAANPNLIYVQTTALNEPMSLALLIWALAYFTDFVTAVTHGEVDAATRPLLRCAWLLAAGMLVRYDAWFTTCIFIIATAFVILVSKVSGRSGLVRDMARFTVICALAPALWFAYNAFVWGNPLEFATGPYSAQAIEERSRRPGDPHHPGWHSPSVAAEHFLRNATLIMGETRTERLAPTSGWEKPWLPLAVIGIALVLAAAPGLWPWLLLWTPVPFYMVSIAWGSVPIFIPHWWPFSYYNTRYGLQLLPGLAAFTAVVVYFGMRAARRTAVRAIVVITALIFVGASYVAVWKNVPICLREVRANGGARYALDRRLAIELRKLPPTATLLMYIGDHGGALQNARIPLRRTINEGNYRQWQAALAQPASHADYAIAGANDPVAKAIAEHSEQVESQTIVEAARQPPVTIYRALK